MTKNISVTTTDGTFKVRVSDNKPSKAPCFKCSAPELKLYVGATMLGLMCYGCDGVWRANEFPGFAR